MSGRRLEGKLASVEKKKYISFVKKGFSASG